ncbi:MAG: peptidoglycan DD-metalloendopeptidase family protein [Fusobacteria bacterium]|nr:peptidoglycan DD-metalloendopeptidase family protein [Fusobacteriota bacterium]
MNKIIKITMLIFVLGVSLFLIPNAGIMGGLEEDAANAQKQIEEFKGKIAEANGDLLEIMSQISAVENSISATEANIDKLNQEIAVIQSSIDSKEQEINKSLEEFNANKKDYYSSLRSKFEDGDADFLEIILNTVNLTELVNYNEYYRIINAKEQEKIDVIKKSKQALEDQKKELEAIKNSVNEKKVAIENSKKQQDIDKQKLDSQKDYFASLANEYQSEVQNQEAALVNINAEIQKSIADLQKAKEEQAAAENNNNNNTGSGGESTTGESGDNGYQQGTGTFTWPVPSSYLITSPFGYRSSPIFGGGEFHKGIDIGAAGGASIVAADSGMVVYAQFNNGGFGNTVIIDHGGGLITLYAHMSSIGVSYGQSVSKGQYIGGVGSTGWSTGNHLHFQVTNNGDIFSGVVDPMGYF